MAGARVRALFDHDAIAFAPHHLALKAATVDAECAGRPHQAHSRKLPEFKNSFFGPSHDFTMVDDARYAVVCRSARSFNFVAIHPLVRKPDAEPHPHGIHLVVRHVPEGMGVDIPQAEGCIVADVYGRQHRPDRAGRDEATHAPVVVPSEGGECLGEGSKAGLPLPRAEADEAQITEIVVLTVSIECQAHRRRSAPQLGREEWPVPGLTEGIHCPCGEGYEDGFLGGAEVDSVGF